MKCHKCGSKDHLQDQCDQATHFAFGGYTLFQTVQNPRIDTPRRTSRSSSSAGTNPPPMVDDSSSDGYARAPARRESSSSESDNYYPKYSSPPDSEWDVPPGAYDVPSHVREQQYIAALTEDQYYMHLGPTGEDEAYQLQLRPRDPENAEYNSEDSGLPVRGEVIVLPIPSAPPAEELNDDDLDTIYSERTESIHALDSSGDNSERRGFGYHLHHTLDDPPTISEDLTNLPCVNPSDDPSVSNFSSTSEETTTLCIENTPNSTWNVQPSSSSQDPIPLSHVTVTDYDKCCRCDGSLHDIDFERNYRCWMCNKVIHETTCVGFRCSQLPALPHDIPDDACCRCGQLIVEDPDRSYTCWKCSRPMHRYSCAAQAFPCGRGFGNRLREVTNVPVEWWDTLEEVD